VENFLKLVTNLLFPTICGGCGKEGALICDECLANIKFSNEQICLVCGHPSVLGHTHENCATKYTPEKFISVFIYKYPISRLIQKIKYRPHAFSLLEPLINVALEDLEERGLEFGLEALVIPVPLHFFKKWQRGFNITELIAQKIGKHLKLKVSNHLSRRIYTQTQTHLNRKERKQNVAGAFSVPSRYQTQLAGQDILLIDDVCTTGATLLAAARALKEAGCNQVWCLALAKD